jgi:hypothetical protein
MKASPIPMQLTAMLPSAQLPMPVIGVSPTRPARFLVQRYCADGAMWQAAIKLEQFLSLVRRMVT